MDPTNELPPLFEAQLVLREPNIIFVPSLNPQDQDSLKIFVEGLIADIMNISSVVKRFSRTRDLSYLDEISTNSDIVDMKLDILQNVDQVIENAYEFCDNFENYAYLWLDNREHYLQQFLTYGRQLNNEENELVILKDSMAPKPKPPKMEQFREQIDNFENIFNEVEHMKTEEVFNAWFKVDIKPFKQALLNIIRKWGNMFKEHLVDNVTNSLTDLGKFIRSADEGLQQTVQEGDYQALVNVMGFLLNVKERQITTDDMFGPLRDTIELLQFYDQDIPEEVHVYLQELPEQWANTKKISVTVKQQVAPLQAAEVTFIRRRIIDFDAKILHYREVFKKYEFFYFLCKEPYRLMDRINRDLEIFEFQMKKIHESGSLFEVSVSDFKILKQCRKDMKMLKVLFEIFIFRKK